MQIKLLLVLSLNDDAGRQDEWMSREGDAELLLYLALTVATGGFGDECLSLGVGVRGCVELRLCVELSDFVPACSDFGRQLVDLSSVG